MIYNKYNFESKNWSFNELEIGEKVYVTVINIKPYGAFV